MMTVTQDGATFAELGALYEARLDDALQTGAGDFDATLRGNEPFRTGVLVGSTYLEQVDARHFVEHVDAPYASWVNDGTRRQPGQFFVEQTIAEVTPRLMDRLAQAGEGLPGWQG